MCAGPAWRSAFFLSHTLSLLKSQTQTLCEVKQWSFRFRSRAKSSIRERERERCWIIDSPKHLRVYHTLILKPFVNQTKTKKCKLLRQSPQHDQQCDSQKILFRNLAPLLRRSCLHRAASSQVPRRQVWCLRRRIPNHSHEARTVEFPRVGGSSCGAVRRLARLL